ncbi:hypothetical protein SERLA73DRAFT_75410 [Serpula lacrymans var. lacrymans S7.3]|uniref:DJ-1/PfpI domain-containing protein n=2 Tax=Serpula lacrymans var. lacrymans TaxID=341189 RepID=F8Q4P0_SERL3|nr:uncharacterized protein SERLADRAFT_394664 [Serpula lacrymans var. lacrymans S7.9]EGN96517.1 hypothetical protein SERLA73DRAFT_75410 [Serpula lacrymans var. lacrymans S7.3]EGO22062.1 hypothetical protein SERLADRAFT_394664 [Serpula lacrymans var. lacrymans S7.9]
MAEPEVLTVAVCIFDKVTALDYQGPMELFGFFQKDFLRNPPEVYPTKVKYAIEPTYFGTSTSIKPFAGPTLSIDAKNVYTTFLDSGDARQFDMIFVPGGAGTRAIKQDDAIIKFIEKQSTKARYILSVCTGAWLLALGGIFFGKKATANKSAWAGNPDVPNVDWVRKARWVVNDKGSAKEIWASSGVTAGMDMANAFLAHLVGRPNSELARHVIEYNAQTDPDIDPFAEYWGLLD